MMHRSATTTTAVTMPTTTTRAEDDDDDFWFAGVGASARLPPSETKKDHSHSWRRQRICHY